MGSAFPRPNSFSNAKHAAVISTRAIWFGSGITQARCRIPSKMEFDSHNGNRLATRAESQVKVISRGELF